MLGRSWKSWGYVPTRGWAWGRGSTDNSIVMFSTWDSPPPSTSCSSSSLVMFLVPDSLMMREEDRNRSHTREVFIIAVVCSTLRFSLARLRNLSQEMTRLSGMRRRWQSWWPVLCHVTLSSQSLTRSHVQRHADQRHLLHRTIPTLTRLNFPLFKYIYLPVGWDPWWTWWAKKYIDCLNLFLFSP